MLFSWHSPSVPILVLVAASLPLLAGCENEQPPEPRTKQIFHLREFEKNFGYAQAVQVDRTLYISSSVAVDAQGRLVAPGDLKGQLQAAYQNLSATLRAHGASFDHVVREDIFTTDMEQLLAVSDLRFDYYSKDGLPAGTWVQVERLIDPGFLVAVSITAELP